MIFDPKWKTIIVADASNDGVAAAFLQKYSGEGGTGCSNKWEVAATTHEDAHLGFVKTSQRLREVFLLAKNG